MTDRYPVDISYVEHLDQVWLVNWRDEQDHGVKTIQVSLNVPIISHNDATPVN